VSAALPKAALQSSPAARAAWLRDAQRLSKDRLSLVVNCAGNKEEADAAVKSIRTRSGRPRAWQPLMEV
jgi:hypothetical protein